MTTTRADVQSGFTFLEVVVALVVGGMLAVLLLTVMSTALINSTGAISQERTDFYMEQVLENITKDYVATENNKTDFTLPLNSTLTTLNTNIGNGNYNSVGGMTASVNAFWVTYDNAGVESVSGVATNALKVEVSLGGRSLTSVFGPGRPDHTSQKLTY